MVRAPKAHKLAQQSSKAGPSAERPDLYANILLEEFDAKLQRGLPDEALECASAAVDLFYKYGDKAGESRALSCVAQAMALGANLPKLEGPGVLRTSEQGSSILQEGSLEWPFPENSYEGHFPTDAFNGNGIHEEWSQADSRVKKPQDNESSVAPTDLTALPISYGERLILEMVMKSRQRPYDRRRQEQLAQPRRRGGSAQAWGVGYAGGSGYGSGGGTDDTADTAGPEQSVPQGGTSASQGASVDPYPSGSMPLSSGSKEPKLSLDQHANLVNRLSQPKRRKPDASKTPGEQILLRNAAQAAKLKSGNLDISSIVTRLSAPRAVRALSPTPGERVVLMWNRNENLRKPDLNRISELAKSSRRGGSARAWGVWYDEPNSARAAGPVEPMAPYSQPPDSARAPPRPRPGNEGAPSADSTLPPLESADSPVVHSTMSPSSWKRSGVDQQA